MKISLLGYILGLLVATTLSIGITTYQLNIAHKQELAELISENDALMFDLATANKELNSYLVTEKSLINLGASHEQAKSIIQASEAHTISPKY